MLTCEPCNLSARVNSNCPPGGRWWAVTRLDEKIEVFLFEVGLDIQDVFGIGFLLVQEIGVQHPYIDIRCSSLQRKVQSRGEALRPVQKPCREAVVLHQEKDIPGTERRAEQCTRPSAELIIEVLLVV